MYDKNCNKIIIKDDGFSYNNNAYAHTGSILTITEVNIRIFKNFAEPNAKFEFFEKHVLIRMGFWESVIIKGYKILGFE